MTYVEWVNAVIDCAARAANDRRRQELEQLERLERAEAERDPRRPGVFAPGDVITYAAKHLQLAYVGLVPIDDAGIVFTVRACDCDLCALGEHVCTTDWLADYGCHRHVHRGVVRHHGAAHAETLAIAPLITIPRVGNTRYVCPSEL
ncbi:MAG TPA: hypothetical protein VKE42_05215 [Candidatus Cybelea sp.]|nr:hypothetical protein [Candidatus Cybelea sp.]